jgi:hypothetical protein
MHRNVKKCVDWIDSHPRVGWYVALIVSADLVLHVVELAKLW